MESASPAAPMSIAANSYQHAQEGIYANGPAQLARGRQAKDPLAKTVSYHVASLAEFETSLREYLDSPIDEPEHTDCQLSFYIEATFEVITNTRPSNAPPMAPLEPLAPLHPPPGMPHVQQHAYAPPAGYQPAHNALHAHSAHNAHGTHHYGAYQSVADPAIALALPFHPPPPPPPPPAPADGKPEPPRITMGIREALQPTDDPKDKMRRQRAIAKCCVDAIQRVDGYRYSFHNCWNSREDDSFRFSYYCNDSLLNKDRAANGKGAKLGKRATKPVYDCKGVLSVKFSASRQSLDVFYKHMPVHKTYEERAPPPRRDSRRRKHLEDHDPEALIRMANRPSLPRSSEDGDPGPPPPPKPRKKRAKRDGESTAATNSIESDLRAQSLQSLLELIRTDPEPAPQPQPEDPRSQNANLAQNAVEQPNQQSAPQQQQQPVRRRVQNSCTVCKTKKTKCNGARPVCNTCIEKNRQCYYADTAAEDHRPSTANASQPAPTNSEATHQAQVASNELSEIEKMRKELEEAKARIHQLEAEKTRSTPTPLQIARVPQPRSHVQPQSQSQSQVQAQPQPQVQPQSLPQIQHQSLPQIQHQSLTQTPHQSLTQTQHQSLPQSQHQSLPQTQHQPQLPSQPPPQQQIHNSQQLQPTTYGHFPSHATHSSYGVGVDRSLEYKNTPQATQAQSAHQMQAPGTGLTPTQDGTNPYSWSAAPFYYQNPQGQDQWPANTRYR